MRQAGEQARGYPSDLTDAQWQVIAPHLPAQVPGRRGRPRIWPMRAIVEAILYLDRAGCPWRYLPDSFPPWRTVYGYFAAWRDDGTLARLHDALRAQVRAADGRDAEPTAAVIDSQSVRAADTVPKATRGWDNAKKVNGRKRHIAVDSAGLLLAVVITAASVQDRDAARPLLWNLHRTSRRIRLIWADGVYAGKLSAWAAAMKMSLQIVARRNPHAFEVLPRRWVVERTFAWISKHRRTVRDYERLPASHEAMILWAMTALMARRLAQPAHLSNTHLAFRLTRTLVPCFEGAFSSGGFPHVVAGRWAAVLRAWRPAGPGIAGFRHTGRAGQGRADVPESAADPGRGQPAWRGGPFPGQAQVRGERPGEPQLGVDGDDEPGPPVRGGRVADLGPGPAEHLLEEPEGVLQVEPAQERLPAPVHVSGQRAGG
jgi:putative transposase